MAQLTKPDMKSSIGYALTYPERLAEVIPRFGLSEMANLEFLPPDPVRFPALPLARKALEAGQSTVIALNAANEIAVEAFLKGKILFPQITQTIEKVLEGHTTQRVSSCSDIFEIDSMTRRQTEDRIARRS